MAQYGFQKSKSLGPQHSLGPDYEEMLMRNKIAEPQADVLSSDAPLGSVTSPQSPQQTAPVNARADLLAQYKANAEARKNQAMTDLEENRVSKEDLSQADRSARFGELLSGLNAGAAKIGNVGGKYVDTSDFSKSMSNDAERQRAGLQNKQRAYSQAGTDLEQALNMEARAAKMPYEMEELASQSEKRNEERMNASQKRDSKSEASKVARESARAQFPLVADAITDNMSAEDIEKRLPGLTSIQNSKQGEIDKRRTLLAELAKTRAEKETRLSEKKLETSGKEETDLRKEFNSHKAVISFPEISFGYDKLKGAANVPDDDPSRAAADMALVFGFMKLQDPNSTVREGEYATAENMKGIPEKTWNLFERVKNGERLSPQQRQAFLAQGTRDFQAAKANYDRYRTQYSGIAQRKGYNPENIFLDDVQMPSVEQPKQSPQGVGATGGVNAKPRSVWENPDKKVGSVQ